MGKIRATEAGRRWTRSRPWTALALGALACSSSGPGPSNAAATAGGAAGVTGNPREQAGGASYGGASSADAGRDGATAGDATANCPLWPISKLMPLVGPFFYGPDPGPCTSAKGSVTFSYAAGRVRSSTDTTQYQTQSFTWQGDRLTSASGGSSADTYTYGPRSVVIASSDSSGRQVLTQTYQLSATGYPLTVSIGNGAGTQTWIKYEYINCLLDRRPETDANWNEIGTPQEKVLTYSYDAKGHVRTRGTEQYDYSCWQAASGGAGGAPGATDGGAAGALDPTVGCPQWPTQKLALLFGALFYGPGPGPCTWTSADGSAVSTFVYSNAVLQSVSNNDGSSEALTWDGERVVSSSETSASGQSVTTSYSYAADSLTLTNTNARFTSTTTYHLSPTGYPLSVEAVSWVTDNPTAKSPVSAASFQYDHCRPSGSSFGFDARGHLVSGAFALNANRSSPYAADGAFDYGCWKP